MATAAAHIATPPARLVCIPAKWPSVIAAPIAYTGAPVKWSALLTGCLWVFLITFMKARMQLIHSII
jgi:hypothetical protein